MSILIGIGEIMFEIGITASSGGIVLLLLGTIIDGFRKKEAFIDRPIRLAVIVAPFLVLAAEPWLGDGTAGFLIRLFGSGLFLLVTAAVVIAARDKKNEKDPWTRADVCVTGVFLTLTMLGAAWLMVRALT
jgi:hypothetical protein